MPVEAQDKNKKVKKKDDLISFTNMSENRSVTSSHLNGSSYFSRDSGILFANTALCFGHNNKFRYCIQKIISTRIFIHTMNIIVVLNCIFLLLETIDKFELYSDYIHDFFTELLPSDNILIYIVINMLSETHWKIQILYNMKRDKEKIINKIRKKINNNFPEDFIIYIDQDYKYISLYLHKMIIIINIIINRVLDNNYEFKFSIYSDRFNLLNEIREEI